MLKFKARLIRDGALIRKPSAELPLMLSIEVVLNSCF